MPSRTVLRIVVVTVVISALAYPCWRMDKSSHVVPENTTSTPASLTAASGKYNTTALFYALQDDYAETFQ
ncbi:hypothetical protein [Dyella sp. M7H15-1]|uniref:hypothetical protein n=1 Tax=Dyella sp. M7H15-1 TaxID=2501295 RepID=UPI0013E8BBAE|nr:hypothetical protein [Dyella sp. M7H15-1]